MNSISLFIKYCLTLAIMLISCMQLLAQDPSEKELDTLIQNARQAFNVPGIAVGLIKDGQIIYSKGFGERSLASKKPVNQQTAFAIASNSKLFTAFALGMLIDEGKLEWDSKVTEFIPEFSMYDPYVSKEFTIRDLLTHRSGLGLGAGDLMFWPDSANFNTQEIIHNLRYLKPVSSFRTKFDYDNLLYIVAGEVIKRISGISWEEFIEKRIMQPLGMTHSAASLSRLKDKQNSIDAHVPVNGQLIISNRNLSEATNAAGGINASIQDMNLWVQMLLNHGTYGKDLEKSLINPSRLKEIMSLQTIINGSTEYKTHFFGYGLGLFLSDQNGYFVAEHTGGLAGMVSQVTMVPELNLGIVVLTNQQNGYAFTAISNQIKDAYFDIQGTDRIKELQSIDQADDQKPKEIVDQIWSHIKTQNQKIDLNPYLGIYQDPWFGNIEILERNNALYFKSARSPKLQGKMHYYKGNTFVAQWNDHSMNADAFVSFTLDENGNAIRIKMKAISPETDFSFDFHDLDLKKINY